jgi:hypothetical protein
MDSKEHLMAVLQNLIHDKQEDATAAIRQAILVKSQQIVGGRQAEAAPAVEPTAQE